MPPRARTPESVSPSRWIAFQTLVDWRSGKGFVEDLLADQWERLQPNREDLRLSQSIVYGVFRNLRRLDFWIDRLAREGIGSLPAPMVDCLRIALFQHAYLNRIPDHATVSQALALCERIGIGGMKPVVNGMLRAFPRRMRELEGAIENSPNRLAIETSHPDWLVEWAVERWGAEKGAFWLKNNNIQPALFLRPVATRLLNREDLQEGLTRETVAAEKLLERLGMGELADEGTAVRLPPNCSLADVEAFSQGLATVQDLSAQRAVDLLAPKTGETIFDLCAAPGGKTIQIADKTRGQSKIIAVDKSAKRLARVEENLIRCGFQSVETIERDLVEPWDKPHASADAVLLDAPCSGLGTLRRRVDLRYRIQPGDIEDLAAMARRLLENTAKLVKPGGRLVYSTCTLTREENAKNVERFLARRSDWDCVEMKEYPSWLAEGSGGGVPETIPDCDGAFMALLIRRGQPGVT